MWSVQGGTFYPREGQFALVQNVRGDIVPYSAECAGGHSARGDDYNIIIVRKSK